MCILVTVKKVLSVRKIVLSLGSQNVDIAAAVLQISTEPLKFSTTKYVTGGQGGGGIR